MKTGFNSTWAMNFQMFKLDLEKAEELEIKLPTSAGSSKKQESSKKKKKTYFCFIDYTKAFDCVDHNKLWKILKEMRISDNLTCLLRNLYASHEATVRPRHGTRNWFKIGKGVHQGFILSSCLFNLYAEYIIQNARQDESSWNEDCQEKYEQPQMCRLYHPNGRKWRGTKEPLDEGERGEWKTCLKTQHSKTKIMASGPITSWQIDGEKVETVKLYFLGLQNHYRRWLQPWN